MAAHSYRWDALISSVKIAIVVETIRMAWWSYSLSLVALGCWCVCCCERFDLAALWFITVSVRLTRGMLLPSIDRSIRWSWRHFVELRKAKWLKLFDATMIRVFWLLDGSWVLLLVWIHYLLKWETSSDCLRRLTWQYLRVGKIWICTPNNLIWTCEFWRRLESLLFN